MSKSPDDKLIEELEGLRERFNRTTDRIVKDIGRQKKIMERSDKRQRQEYDELQRRFDEIERLNKEIEETQREVVFTMGAIGESRSKETGNHVRRVAEYSKLFALYYGLAEEEAELLKQASPMHDIGKVAIPDSILNKPGRLDEHEREVMNTHAQLGYEMLAYSTRPLLKLAATVAYEHHEKWDGSGYPRGLKGKDIHIGGRITALADVFDALGSERCYKNAWDDARIFELFREEKGKHFDPDLIDIFFQHIDEFLEIRDRLKDDL
ncbi:RESPONSE REGULATOR PROTEIN-CheY-like nd an HD-GYP domain [Marinobacterium lacunae]|uniref:RESPONSE REGULATOR PROTEIN-CheY-like nd an HD-GYP domain n=1 Tax=Marinobacterium lacunae TaxID=1232683 RepID=A0A081G1L3_9GAMM|nr:HD domain-containing phosphohydrolase [Marinobacterium lacunae]KEA64668.1 RESPONSE REGULATOR PROTEIN-CheY-like nd an HD-GYP domain [Marinobacterium lacunae]